MKDLLELMKTRRSVRKYKPDMIPQDVLNRIIIAGTYSATGRNLQSPIIIAVTNKEMRDKISEMNRKIGGWAEGFDPFYGAPVILIVLADKSCRLIFMTEVLLWEILCLPLTTRALEAAGYIVQRKNLSLKKARRSSAALASRANTRASVTAHSATLRVNIPRVTREKTIGYTISNNPDKLSNKKRSGQNRSVFFLINELSRQKILCRPACPHMLRNTRTLCQQLSPCHCCLS